MRRRNQNVLPNVCFLATLLAWSGGRSLFSQAWSKAIDPIHSEAVPRLLIVRLQTEDVFLHAQQSEANLRAWCDGCQTFGWHCDYHIFRSVPIKSVMYHPSFAHFSTTLMALLYHHENGSRKREDADNRNITWISDSSIDEAGRPATSIDSSEFSMVIFIDSNHIFSRLSSPDEFLEAFRIEQGRGSSIVGQESLRPPLAFVANALEEVTLGFFLIIPDATLRGNSFKRAVNVLTELEQYVPDLERPANEVFESDDGQQYTTFRFHLASSASGRMATLPFARGQLELLMLEHERATDYIRISQNDIYLEDENRTHCTLSLPHEDKMRAHLVRRFSPSCNIAELAQLFKQLNRNKNIPSPPFGAANPHIPVIGLVAYGEEHNRKETAHFFRSLFVHRSLPLKIIIIGDDTGLRTIFDVMANHALIDLIDKRDEIRIVNMDVLLRWLEIERLIHPQTKRRHPRLFIKLFTHDLFPHLSKIMMLDNDLIVLDDIKNLWTQFDQFEPKQLVSMTVDQSNRWYYRFQDPLDEIYSPGWVGLANRCGVNGGIQLWHNDNVRRIAPNWSFTAVKLTHTGTHRAEKDLQYFGILQEQDLLNVAIIDNPEMWKPLDCIWNYLPKTIGPHGGHITETINGTLSTFIDRCHSHYAHSVEQPELFGCSCGRKVRILHFVGMTKESNPQAHLLFQFWGHAPLYQLQMVAQQNINAPDDEGAGAGAVRLQSEVPAFVSV